MYKKLIEKIIQLNFSWNVGDICSALRNAGLIEVETVQGRISFSDHDADDTYFDVYYQEDRQVQFIEINTDVFLDSDSLTESEYDDKVDEFYSKFNEGISEISTILGKPAFADGAAACGFPSDQDANWLALWNLPCQRLMLQQKNEGSDMPFRICLVVAPLGGGVSA